VARGAQQVNFARGRWAGRAAMAGGGSAFLGAGQRGRIAQIPALGSIPASRFVLPPMRDARRALGWVGPGILLYPALAWTPIYWGIFWPSPSYAEYWPYGYETIFEGAFAEGIFTDYGPEPPPRRSRRAALDSSGSPATFDSLCRDEAAALPDAILAAVEQALELDDVQRAALQEFKAATAKAAELIRTSCPAALPANPIARLELMERQTGVIIEALGLIRPALGNFERSLSDEKRARFAMLTVRHEPAKRAGKRDAAATCERQAASLTDWPIERISQAVRPTESQRDKLVDLWAASMKSANRLKAECPEQIPVTPLARLEMMEKQLDATRQAVKTVRTALSEFYEDLNADQKARFDQMSGLGTRG
jgi:hypothetical protein